MDGHVDAVSCMAKNPNHFNGILSGSMDGVVPIERSTGHRTTRSRRQDLSTLNAKFQVCRDMRFRSSHGFEMRKHDKQAAKQAIDTSLSSLVVPIERPTRYRTARSRRQDLSVLNAKFQVCQGMRFRSSHDLEIRKHDKRVAKQAIDTARRKIARSLQAREEKIDKRAINTARRRIARSLLTHEQRMAIQAIDTARRRIARSLLTHEQRVALKVRDTTRRRNRRAQQKAQQRVGTINMEGAATATATATATPAKDIERNLAVESTEQQGGSTTTTSSNATDNHHLIGTYVGIDSSDGNVRLLLGKVLTYDSATKLFTIFYENGNREVLDCQHVTEILIMDHTKLSHRKRKLDHLAVSGEITRPNTRSRKNNPTDVTQPPASLPCQLASESDADGDDDKDSFTVPCDYDHNSVPSSPSQVQILPLPPSSGDINVPDESVPYLFSVYNCLRSFSIQLFLSPFGLDDFVGSLNCIVQNSLLDAIHLSLMQALRRHLQTLSSEDSKLACKFLRYCDWTLLDSVTWPAILAGYLCVMGYMKELDDKGFSFTVSGGEYYVLPVGLKLKILQILCDDIVDSEEIRTELEMRVDTEEVDDYAVNYKDPPESGPRRVHPRYTKTSACRNLEALKNSVEPKRPILNSKTSVSDPYTSDPAQDANSDECRLCGMDGMLIRCDGCPSSYHSRCIGLNKTHLPDGAWFCTECIANKLGMTSSRVGRGTSGAEIFGTDVNGRMFLGTCNYLLVVGTSLISESIIRYYNSDSITEVLSVILAAESSSVYTDICRGISKYWKVPLIDVQPGKPGPLWDSFVDKEPRLCYTPCITSSMMITSDVLNVANEVRYMTNATKGSPNGRDVFKKDHCLEDVNGTTIESMKITNESVTNESRLECHTNDDNYRIRSQMNSRVPALFQPQAYINQYIQGDVAASSAANLAVLASEESNVSEARVSSNPRKAVVANTALQMKAFSGATSNFFWPGFDKKLMEIPRERCGWCIACKAASTWKKGCLLNFAATNALRRSARNFCGFRRVKHVESYLLIVAAQISHMEVSLRGLISGPLSDVQYNKHWHKLAREASSCKVLKFLLLELEENIHGITFCGEWTKLVDDWMIEFSSAASGLCCSGTNSKHGPGGRLYRKQPETSEFENDFSSDDLENVLWWRGGKLSKFFFQKGMLSSSLVKKMGRQGGTRRISGIYYPDGFELPRRSRQFAWRASVEMSTNVSQLALQVRYLYAHVRWKDLVRPDQSAVDSEDSDADAMAFRNAVICDKRISENMIKYALRFSIQKHFSLRVTKNILETENLPDGNEKLWFLESHVPLYLIKEYEEKIVLKPVPSPMMLRSHNLLRLRKRQLKGQGDIFSYLMHKGKESSRFSCPSCQQEVFLRDSARCNACQGYCHKDCISIAVKEDLEFVFPCKFCDTKSGAPISGKKETLNTLLNLKGLNQQSSLHGQIQHQTRFKCRLQSRYHNPAQPLFVKKEISSLITSSGSGSKSVPKVRRGRQNFSYGLIWKRKKGDDSGQDFRINNILLKGKEVAHPKVSITCSLCNKPYRSDLMYIRCGNCSKWCHADALQLEEAQIFDLVGFKCCHCRKKASPKCPYSDSNYKRVDRQTRMLATAEGHEGILSKAPMLGHLNSTLSNSSTEDFVTMDDDPLLYSFGKIEPIREHLDMKEQLGGQILPTKSQQKLSVRRPMVEQEKGAYEVRPTHNVNPRFTESHESLHTLWVSRQPVECGAVVDPGLASAPKKLPSAQVEWDSSEACGFGDEALKTLELGDQLNDSEIGMGGDMECEPQTDMEYEPQTYFSFHELLAANNQVDTRYDTPMHDPGEWPFINIEETHQNVPPCGTSGGECGMGSVKEFGAFKVPVFGLDCGAMSSVQKQ